MRVRVTPNHVSPLGLPPPQASLASVKATLADAEARAAKAAELAAALAAAQAEVEAARKEADTAAAERDAQVRGGAQRLRRVGATWYLVPVHSPCVCVCDVCTSVCALSPLPLQAQATTAAQEQVKALTEQLEKVGGAGVQEASWAWRAL